MCSKPVEIFNCVAECIVKQQNFTMEESVHIFVGNIIHCDKPFNVVALQKGFVAVQKEKIIAIGDLATLESFTKNLKTENVSQNILRDSQILIPGLVDTHIHACQYPNIGLGMSTFQIPWLWEWTFPLEKKFKDLEFSKKCYEAIVRRTLDNGTTTASYYATIYTESALILADSALKFGQRALIGKVNQIQHCPDDYRETDETFLSETRKFIIEMKNKQSSLVQPVITPRSAGSLVVENMVQLFELAKLFNLKVQSHLKEGLEEFKVPTAPVDDNRHQYKFKLFPNKTLFTHCLHVSKEEIQLLVDSGSTVAHCPNANIHLRSGVCDVKALIEAGITVGLGTDLSGGYSLSLVNAMRYAVASSIFLSFGKEDYNPLNCYDAFYMATLGGAKALGMDNDIGNFEVGKEFDALIVDMDVTNGPIDYLGEYSAMEILQKFIYTSDDRNIISVYVAGKKVK